VSIDIQVLYQWHHTVEMVEGTVVVMVVVETVEGLEAEKVEGMEEEKMEVVMGEELTEEGVVEMAVKKEEGKMVED
jgi:hypothetical protein